MMRFSFSGKEMGKQKLFYQLLIVKQFFLIFR